MKMEFRRGGGRRFFFLHCQPLQLIRQAMRLDYPWHGVRGLRGEGCGGKVGCRIYFTASSRLPCALRIRPSTPSELAVSGEVGPTVLTKTSRASRMWDAASSNRPNASKHWPTDLCRFVGVRIVGPGARD